MTTKSNVQSFQTSWNKTVNWAKAQGIPQSAIYPVYQLDSKRLLSGTYPMSEAERTRAILAASNPNNVTPLPTDTPSTGSGLSAIGHFFGNVVHDASNIFTGLQPTKLIPSIVDGVVNTIEHPSWVLNPEKNTIAQWIPGVAVVGEYMQGGLSNVLSHPLISFLDVLPAADTGVGILAKAGLGAGIAERAGIPEALLGHSRLLGQDAQNGVGALTLARKIVGNTKLPGAPKGLYRDAEGLPQFGPLTVTQRLKAYSNTHMMGTDQAKLAGSMVKVTSAASHELARRSQSWDEAYSKLSADQARQAYDIWTGLDKVLGGNDRQSLLNNNALDPEIKDFFRKTFEVVDYVQEKQLAAEEGADVMMPDGTHEWRTASGTDQKVIVARQRLLDASEEVDKASEKTDKIASNITKNDTIAQPAFATLTEYGARARNALDDPDQVAQLIGRPTANATQIRLVHQIFGDGQLIDQVMEAYEDKDFNAMRGLTLKLQKKFRNKSISGDIAAPDPLNTGLQVPIRVSPLFQTARQLSENLYKYAKGRKKDEDALSKSVFKDGLHKKVDAYAKATKHFNQVWRDNPAAAWQPLLIRLQEKNLAESEEGKVAVAQALEHYRKEGLVKADAEREFREDPTRLVGLIMAHTKASLTSVFGGMVSPGEINRALESGKDEIESLRAQGFVPHWVPNITAAEASRFGDYNVRIQPLTHMSVDAAKAKMLDMRNTVFDMHAGFSKAMWEQVARDANMTFIDDIVIPGHAYKQADLESIASKMHPELGNLATQEAYMARLFDSWGLTKFDPDARFGISSKHIKGGETLWMPKDMVDGLQQVVERNQTDPSGGLATATRVFRTAVLGYSPRFVAHIGLGGTFLLALRHPLSFRFIPDALRMMKDPDFRAQIHTTSTQIGYDKPESMGARAFAEAAGKRFVWDWGQHVMESLNLDPSKMSSWLKVIPQITFKLTNHMTDMQRTLVYLDGAAKAEGRGFYIDPESGERIQMTDARAQEEGMRAANRTMGNLSAMSPFERNMMTTIMPFYGWTRHVLTYVAEYPVDHPYRAMFLANLANMNSDQVSKALYTRIQNLFFLGSPDAQGNVSAVDVRALNPLRDVANYATLGGVISALNPVISAPFAMVDPQIVFGSNLLYPTTTYSQLYGTREAAASGGALTALEQFIPEATTVDAALGLSAQYRGLQRSNPAAFTKLIFESLNIPFAQVQKINLKQIAAQQEIDRYTAASQAAQNAFQSGDFSGLGNVASVPNPLQTDYNIAPADLEALYNQTLKQTGLPPSEVLPSLPAPTSI